MGLDGNEFADGLAKTVGQAVSEHLAANGGGMVMGFALFVDVLDDGGERTWATAHGEDQTGAQTLGMLAFHTRTVERQVDRYLDECDDD